MALEDLKIRINVDMPGATQALAAMSELKTVFEEASADATTAQFNMKNLSRSLTAVAIAARPLALVHQHLRLVSGAATLAATGATQTAGAFGVLSTAATWLASGIAIVMAPLKGLVIIPKLIATSFAIMFAVITAPLKILIGMMKAFAQAVWMVVKPFLRVALVIFRVKMFFQSLKIQLFLLKKLFEILPPKMRVVVGGLMAIGAVAQVSKTAASLLTKSMTVLATAFAALVHPIATAKAMLLLTTVRMGLFALATARAAKALLSFVVAKTIAGLQGLGKAVVSVSGMIAGRLFSALTRTVKLLAVIGAVATGWGIKLAADAEQAEIAFGTMLKSATAAKAVLAELEEFAASTPFQLTSLRDGAKQLLNAQVPAQDLTKRLTMLGDIAAGTGKPINDFVRIFAKVKSTGKVSLETLNQLAERGVPIYTALQSQLGKSRTEMLDMISRGKVGFTDMDGALRSLTEGSGVFAGGMAAQSQTVTGLWSTMKDNVAFAARELGMNMIAAFDFKEILARGIELFQSLRQGIANAMPAFTAVATVVRAAFSAVWEVVSVVFSGITSLLGVTSGNWMQSFVEWAAIASFAFKAWPDLAQLAFTKLQLWLVQAGSQFVHLFTGVLPALFTWFSDNWREIFFTAADLVASVFINIGKNIRSAMTAIWEFIKSGGTSSLTIAWTPLLDGFRNTISELPDIPPRAISNLEKQLQQDSERLGSALSTGLADEIAANLQMLQDWKVAQANLEKPTLDGVGGPDAQEDPTASNAAVASANAVQNKAALVRSSAGQAVVSQFLRGAAQSDDTKKQTAAVVASAGHLDEIKREQRRRRGRVRTEQFGAA